MSFTVPSGAVFGDLLHSPAVRRALARRLVVMEPPRMLAADTSRVSLARTLSCVALSAPGALLVGLGVPIAALLGGEAFAAPGHPYAAGGAVFAAALALGGALLLAGAADERLAAHPGLRTYGAFGGALLSLTALTALVLVLPDSNACFALGWWDCEETIGRITGSPLVMILPALLAVDLALGAWRLGHRTGARASSGHR